MAAGLILAVMALFMAPMSVRELCTEFNRDDFMRDELELESFDPGRGGDSSRLEGRIVYLPKQGVWSTAHKISEFRVQSPEEFAQGLPVGLIAANVVIGLASVFLIRRGAGYP